MHFVRAWVDREEDDEEEREVDGDGDGEGDRGMEEMMQGKGRE